MITDEKMLEMLPPRVGAKYIANRNLIVMCSQVRQDIELKKYEEVQVTRLTWRGDPDYLVMKGLGRPFAIRHDELKDMFTRVPQDRYVIRYN